MNQATKFLIEFAALIFPFAFIWVVFEPVWWIGFGVGVVFLVYATLWASFNVWLSQRAIAAYLEQQRMLNTLMGDGASGLIPMQPYDLEAPLEPNVTEEKNRNEEKNKGYA